MKAVPVTEMETHCTSCFFGVVEVSIADYSVLAVSEELIATKPGRLIALPGVIYMML
jgi:hypothetical protein